MSADRAPGAPRLIEWTGERCVPWAPDVPVIYEHYHRYLWAASLLGGRRVLDLASGEGFGTAILARVAASVVGVDIEERAVEHSRANYRSPKVEFHVRDARELSGFDEGSFDAVVAFEMIEHLAEHERVLEEVRRVLAPDGLLVISTPERTTYSERTGYENPFHVRELTRAEFVALLQRSFANVSTWGQLTISGSLLSVLDGTDEDARRPEQDSFWIERNEGLWQLADDVEPRYVIAVASNAVLPKISPRSVLADGGLELLRAAEEAQAQSAQAQARTAEAQTQAERAAGEARAHGESLSVALAEARAALAEGEQRRQRLERTVAELEPELAAALKFRARVHASVSWRIFQRVRGHFYWALGGERSPAARAVQRALRATGRLLTPGRPPGDAG